MAAKSINLIFTAVIAGIAGTPDFKNREQVKFNQNQLIGVEEEQTELNIKFKKRLNKPANAMNQIHKYETNKQTHMLKIILAKNRTTDARPGNKYTGPSC